MPERISVVEFLAETKDDYYSPTTSTFTSKMTLCRSTITALEESLDADRSALKKMKNAVKAMYNSGSAHVGNESMFIENLEKLGSHALHNVKEPEPDIGSAFLKLAVFTKELTVLLKNMVTNINNIVMFPLESLLKGDLKGIKGDMKRPFDKSWKDYDTKVKQVEREKRQLAKEAGMIRNEISGGEIAEEMEKERRMFQLQMCEYLIKANEIKSKKGVDMLQHLVDYYHAQNTFFNEGCRVAEHFQSYAKELSANLHSIRQSQDEERRQLVELRSLLRTAVGESNSSKSGPSVYNLHQLQGLKEFGNEKVGFLMKRSEGLRKAWQKRKCTVSDGYLTISHNNANKPPVKLNLLTSQVKPVSEDKKIFDLVSHNRTYRFMADDENEAMAWVSVISNSKEDALNRVFGEEGGSKEQNTGLKELTKSILDEVRNLPGNNVCCDCDAKDPTWLSTNMGVLLCIECSGIHRDMGVHISRIQSITLDELGTSELLLARAVGNAGFNDIMEAKLDIDDKPKPSSDMETRKSFIRDKYESHRYAIHTCNDDPDRLLEELLQAVQSKDIYVLLQVFAEGVDLSSTLPGSNNGETALHIAIKQEDRTSLFIVDFLVQNSSPSLNRQTISEGSTPLHVCAEHNKTECMKLLLRTRAKTDIKNTMNETPIDVARRKRNSSCEELLTQASSGKFHPIVHVDVDWNFSFVEEDDFDYPPDNSDDEVEEKLSLNIPSYNSPYKPGPIPSARNRPISAINPGQNTTPDSSRQRPSSFKETFKPPVPLPNHSANPNAPQPPPRPDKLASPAAASNISRNRSRTVAPVQNIKEHRRTNSDTRPAHTNAPPPRQPTVSSALEAILANKGTPPPLPTHQPSYNPSRLHQSNTPKQQEVRRDSMNESSSKAGNKTALKPKHQLHHSFSIISSIQSVLKHQRSKPTSQSRSSLGSHSAIALGPCGEAVTSSTLPNYSAFPTSTKSTKHLIENKDRRRTTNFDQSLSACRSLESLLTTRHPKMSKSDKNHDLSFQSLCPSPRGAPAKFHATILEPHSPPVSSDIEQSFPCDSKNHPLYSNCGIGFYDNTLSKPLSLQDESGIYDNPLHNLGISMIPQKTLECFSGCGGVTLLQSSSNNSKIHGGVQRSSTSEKSSGKNLFPQSSAPALPNKNVSNREPPPPLPRSSGSAGSRPKRVRAIYDCEADNPDELTFVENEIIVITGLEDQEWWVGHIEHQPHRSGVFPVSFVHVLPE